jgi:hypothetical protein
MGDPARRNENGPGPGGPAAGRTDPTAPGWADVRHALVTEARACALAVTELARKPGDKGALEMAGLTLRVLEDLGVIARRWEVDEAVIEAERARAFEEGRQACLAARSRLEVIDGGQAG